MIELILGGARSGKSTLAEQRASGTGYPVTYIATATAGDDEMAARIAHHQQRRPDSWTVLEEPLQLANAIQQCASRQSCILVDCLTLWLSNLLHAGDAVLQTETEALIKLSENITGEIILVSNEVGMGVVPNGELSRRFVDEAGRLHQQLAKQCDRVTLVVAGLEHRIKG